MIRSSAKLLLAALLCAGCAVARAADLYLICNSGVSLAASDVRDLFLGEKQFAGELRLVPVDNSAAQNLFLERVLKMNVAKYSTTWTKKSFRDGINPPLVTGSDAEALAYVKRTPGACSYVGTPNTVGVRVVSTL
ncbi:MAG: phosphate ABC transporter substrate-binding protein [Gammaproteobacteria bacterium]|nr:MAG: phosphate ABC transporter substrate-binding protein [Gammaproteobacteria bacterium]TLY72479.1 MAG: phosphate ABC transporter substrate-binding protein [Gammaproteobacteria bacterium]